MPKLKTKKTLLKRVKISKSGKIRKKSINASHLKRKWSANKKYRKRKTGSVKNPGHKRKIKRLLGKHARKV